MRIKVGYIFNINFLDLITFKGKEERDYNLHNKMNNDKKFASKKDLITRGGKKFKEFASEIKLFELKQTKTQSKKIKLNFSGINC